MEVKVTFVEKRILAFSMWVRRMSLNIEKLVWRKYDKDLVYRGHTYYVNDGRLIFSKKREES